MEPWIEGLWTPLKAEVERLQSPDSCEHTADEADSSSARGDSGESVSPAIANGLDEPKAAKIVENEKDVAKPQDVISVANGEASHAEKKTRTNRENDINLTRKPKETSNAKEEQRTNEQRKTEEHGVAVNGHEAVNVTDEAVGSLTHSVPPLCDSALNLPVLPPAYLKITYCPEDTNVSTKRSTNLRVVIPESWFSRIIH